MRSQILKKRTFDSDPGSNLTSYLIYNEAGSQVGIPENLILSLFGDFRTHMSQSVEKYLDVVGAWLIVR